MVELMRGVVQHGTGVRLRYRYKIPGDIIGKTGTTSNYADGWFIGCTPNLVAGSWSGCDDRYIRFRSMQYGQGATMALPVWAYFFQRVNNDSTNFSNEFNATTTFTTPDGVSSLVYDCAKYNQQGGTGTKKVGNDFD